MPAVPTAPERRPPPARPEEDGATVSAGSLAGGRLGDRLHETVSRVLTRDYRDRQSQLARGVRGHRTHACDLGVAEDRRQAVFREGADEVAYRRRSRERDHVHPFALEKAYQGRTRIGRGDGAVDGQDVDLGTSICKQRW